MTVDNEQDKYVLPVFSLRDLLAAASLQGLIAARNWNFSEEIIGAMRPKFLFEAIGLCAYEVADAVLKVKSEQPSREFKGLELEEQLAIAEKFKLKNFQIIREVEAALRLKNTGE